MTPTRSHAFDENPYASPREDAWERAGTAADSDSPEDRTAYYGSLSRAVRYALIQQTIVVVIASQVLDGGDTFMLAGIAAILAFIPIVVIALRRALSEHYVFSRWDRAIIRYGFWGFFLVMCLLYSFGRLPDNFYRANRMPRPSAAERR